MTGLSFDHLRTQRDLVLRVLRENYGVRVQACDLRLSECLSPRYVRIPLLLTAGEEWKRVKAQEKHIALLLGVQDVEVYTEGTRIWCIWPRKDPQDVYLKDYLSRFPKPDQVGVAAVGIGMNNAPVAINLARQPHTLIVGASGAGKTVIQRSLITSLAYWYEPGEVGLLLCDGKGGESFEVFQPKNGSYLNHLVLPVSYDIPDMALAVAHLTRILHSRLSVKRSTPWRPLIFLVVDELANIVALAGKQIEQQVKNILYLGRSAGIHVVAATQKADVAAIKGLNSFFVGRIVLRVVTANDAYLAAGRGSSGAHRLCMQGDMLVGESLERTQGFMVDDLDIRDLLGFRYVQGKLQVKPPEREAFEPETGPSGPGRPLSDIEDSELESARVYVQASGTLPSVNKIMKGRITGTGMGYGRAMRLRHRLEQEGTVE